MTVLVTGSSGHLGEALMRTLSEAGREAVGLDIIAGPFTDEVGSIGDRPCVARCLNGVRTVDGVEDSKHASGRVALQGFAGTIKFRKVEIKPL